MPQNRPKPEKCVKQYGLSLTATAFLPTSRWGGWVAVGGGGKLLNRRKSIYGKNAAVYSLIVSLTDL
jgi:hypothetical protein